MDGEDHTSLLPTTEARGTCLARLAYIHRFPVRQEVQSDDDRIRL